ncbi:MAG: magnesium transporter CorA family protein [Bacteroides sp.]
MINIYRTDDQILHEVHEIHEGVWICLMAPTAEETQKMADELDIDIDDIRASLDEEESSRIELKDGYTLILIDVPITEIRHEREVYTTLPLAIILTQDIIMTVSKEENNSIISAFIDGKVRDFSTKKKLRFVYQILFRTAMLYQAELRIMDKKRIEIEEHVGDKTQDSDLIALHELESTLVYFATSLRANRVVLERLSHYKRLQQYPDDIELLEDVVVETQQAIEMASIYKDIINGTRELLSSVLNSRLNNVMKYLTSITLVMAFPTVISGLYGMNVEGMPFASSAHAFMIICAMIVIICIVVTIWLRKNKML